MSGSSSSGRSFTGGGGSGSMSTPSIPCSDLKGITKVISPLMSFFSTALLNDKLGVVLVRGIVVLVDEHGDEVGTINPPWIDELIDCLNNGNKYNATIKSIAGASIDVEVKWVSL